VKEDELPPGWVWSTLGELGEWYGGGTPSKRNQAFWLDGTVPWLSPKDMGPDTLSRTQDLITEVAVEQSATRLVPAGSVAIVTRSGVLEHDVPIAVVPFATTLNQDMKAIVPAEGINERWLAWAIRALKRDILRTCRKAGTTVASISTAALLGLRIPIPPTAEQERIVEALEDHLSRLDAASENLRLGAKRIPALRGGVRSQLVCLNNSTTRLPEGWSWGVLSDVLAEIQAGKSFRCEPRPAVPGEWGIVKVSAMTWGEFRPSENKAVIAGREIEERYEIRPGDILVSRANTREYVGASVIVRTCPPRLLLSDKSLRLVPKPEVDREWLLQVLSSPYVRRQISEKATGTKDSMRNISQKALRQIRIAIPPMGDMESIGADVSAALVQVEELNDSLCRSIARATNLRWGILKRAFSGKLVRQNSSEESASILLERIRAERATQPKLTRRRAAEVVVTSARPAPPVSSDPAGTFVQEELGL
jgi:type I restriction enzyme S subunit